MATALERLRTYGQPAAQEDEPLSALERLRRYQPTVSQEAPVAVAPTPTPEEEPGFWDQASAAASAFGDYAVGGFADAVSGGARALGEDPSLLTQAINPVAAVLRQTGMMDAPPQDPNLLRFADEFQDPTRAQEAAQTLADAGIEEDSLLASAARAGGSVGTMAAGVGAGFLTRSPNIGAAVMGAGAYGSAYNEDIGEDASVEEKQRRASLQAGVEFAAERLGLKYILPSGTRKGVMTALGKVAAAGGVGAAEEAATSVAQMGLDEAMGYQDFTTEDYTRAIQDSAVAGGVLSAAAGAGGAIADVTRSEPTPPLEAPVRPPTGDAAFDAGQVAAANASPVQSDTERSRGIAEDAPQVPLPRLTFATNPRANPVPSRPLSDAGAIIDDRLARLDEVSAGALSSQEASNLANEQAELEELIREQDRLLNSGVVLGPRSKLTQQERSFIDNRRVEIRNQLERHKAARGAGYEAQALRDRLSKIDKDSDLLALSERLSPSAPQVPLVESPTPVVPPTVVGPLPAAQRARLLNGRFAPASNVTQEAMTVAPEATPTPVVDDALTPATPEDVQSITNRVETEQRLLNNPRNRDRVLTELSTSKDAAAIQQMLNSGQIVFYGDQQTLPEGANSATDKGYFDGQRIYLNESMLNEGEAGSVVLHEVKHFMDRQAESQGQQINRRSLRQFLGNEGNMRVNARINELASTGNALAREAIEDARAGATFNGQLNQQVFDDEIVPYFLQRVADARRNKRPIARAAAVIQDIVSAVKAKISDFGLKDFNLTENDILYLGRQLVGEAARVRNSATPSAEVNAPTGRAMLVGRGAQNFAQYEQEGNTFQGALDNLPRAEIDDSRSSIRPEGKELIQKNGSTFLGALFTHPELYDNYPDLKRTRVRTLTPEEIRQSPDISGYADSETNSIVVHPRLLEGNQTELRRLLAHEGQHLVQDKEGFVPGASVSEYMEPRDMQMYQVAANNLLGFTNNVDRDVLNSIANKTFEGQQDRPVAAQNILNAALRKDRTLQSFDREEQAMLREYTDLVRAYTPLEEKRIQALDKYRRTGGEVEARTVESRLDMTRGERQETPFYDSARRMATGVRQEDMIDNTKPESGSRLAQTRAATQNRAQSASAGTTARASRVRNSQIDTPEFKRWFGDSKVVDAAGEPLVMYHGTSGSDGGQAFDFFDTYASNYGLMGTGSYFTDDPAVASSYTNKGRGQTPSVYPVYLSIKNPLDMDAVGDVENWRKGFSRVDFKNEEIEPSGPDGQFTNEDYFRMAEFYFQEKRFPSYEGAEAMQEGIRRMGYDGITHIGGGRFGGKDASDVRHRVFIAFEPEQIKSSIGNSGAFDPTKIRMYASKTRPMNPERVQKKVGQAGVQQPIAKNAPVPTQARGVTKQTNNRFVKEKTVAAEERTLGQVAGQIGKTLVAAVAPSTFGKPADVQEVLERSLGESSVAKVKAAQALNNLNKSVKRVPKAQRKAVERLLIGASSRDDATRQKALSDLKANHPFVYAQYGNMRAQIRQMSLDAIVSIRDSGKQLTKKDVAVINKIFTNLDSYLTRAYKADYKGPIAKQWVKDTYGAWKAKDGSEGAQVFEDAKEFLKNSLNIGRYTSKSKKPEDYDFESMEQLEALHSEWVSRENARPLWQGATDEERIAYVNGLLSDLKNVRDSMNETDYLAKIDDKALRLTKEMLGVINKNTSKLVQFYRGARQDNTIVSTRSDIPEPLRKLMGEITEPAAALAITMMKQGEFLARQKMLRELYDIGLGRYFVDQKDAQSDTFTERLTGETFGPLEGVYATPTFKAAVESNVEPLNSWQKVLDAMISGKADIAAQAAAGQSLGLLTKAGGLNKKMTVIWNPSSWVNNFLGGPATPIMQGFAPGQGLARGYKAARDLVGPSFNKTLSPEAERVLKANLQESGQVGEIQSAQQDIIRDLLVDDGVFSKAGRTYRHSTDKVTDAYAMTDVVWKLSTFFAKVDWLKSYYKAKGETRTDEQIDREAAQYVKDRAITFSRAAPLVKFTEKLGLTSYAPYFYETYRTLGKSLIGSVEYIADGMKEGGSAGAMKRNLGIRSLVGATSALLYNRAILPAYQVAGAAAMTGLTAAGIFGAAAEEDEERLEVIRQGMSDFYAGKELTLHAITDDGKYVFIEPGRINPNDPATGPLWAATFGGDPEAALEMVTGLFFANQGIASILSVGQEVLGGEEAKKPSVAYLMPTDYNEMVDSLQNNLGLSPNKSAQIARVLEKYIPKVARTTMAETREDSGLVKGDRILSAMGYPFAIFDPKKDLRMSGFKDYVGALDDAKADFKSSIQTVNPSDETIRSSYLSAIRQDHEAFARMRQVVEAANAARLPVKDIRAILKEELSLNNTQVDTLLSGNYRPTFISGQSLGNLRTAEVKAAKNLTEAEKIGKKYDRIIRVINETNQEFKELLEERN